MEERFASFTFSLWLCSRSVEIRAFSVGSVFGAARLQDRMKIRSVCTNCYTEQFVALCFRSTLSSACKRLPYDCRSCVASVAVSVIGGIWQMRLSELPYTLQQKRAFGCWIRIEEIAFLLQFDCILYGNCCFEFALHSGCSKHIITFNQHNQISYWLWHFII